LQSAAFFCANPSVLIPPPPPTALTGSQAESQAPIQGLRKAMADGTRLRRAVTEETYWAYSGMCLCVFVYVFVFPLRKVWWCSGTPWNIWRGWNLVVKNKEITRKVSRHFFTKTASS